MPTFHVPNTAVIPAFNELSNLQRWLRPGLFAYMVAQHVDQLQPVAVKLYAQRQAMVDEAGARHPADHPKAGQLVIEMQPGVGAVTKYKTPEAGAEFKRREAELMAGTTEVTVDKRLTFAWIERLDAERLPAPRLQAGDAEPVEARGVDFVALFPLIDRASYDSNGVAVPATSPAAAREPAGTLAAVL